MTPSMTRWRRNTGQRPQRDDDSAPPIDRVFVRLRNGREPAESWPACTGRQPTTRWTLTGHPFDILEWRPA